MRYAYWITEATDVHSDYVILIDFPHQQWLRERASVIPYTYIAFVFQKHANSSFDTQFKHPTYPSATRSSNVHGVLLCNGTVRKVAVVLVLQKITLVKSVTFNRELICTEVSRLTVHHRDCRQSVR
jgi:hypothetical protein